MSDFLSPEWLRALNERLAQLVIPVAKRAQFDPPIVVECVVRDADQASDHENRTQRAQDQGLQRWFLVLDATGVSLTAQMPKTQMPTAQKRSEPSLTLFADAATLASLAAGTTNAQHAIDAGHLKIRGDLNRIAGIASALQRFAPTAAPDDTPR